MTHTIGRGGAPSNDPRVISPPGAAEPAPQSYEEFLADIKARIRSAQARAARAINAELIEVYWQIGREILRRQEQEGPELGRRTRGVVQRLSADLRIDGLEEEMEGLRRVEQQVTEYAARRARELSDKAEHA